MFTGIVQEVSKILSITSRSGGKLLKISFNKIEPKIGDSIAINGVCLTVCNVNNKWFEVFVSKESLLKTNLSQITTTSKVNLEPALKIGDEIGGHLIYGHIDFLSKLLNKKRYGDSFYFSFYIQDDMKKYLAKNGNIAINGVSLTIASIKKWFDVVVVPYTFKNTTLGELKIGELVNVEIDILSKYLRSNYSF